MSADKKEPSAEETAGLEESMAKLEEIVTDLESGEFPLEEALEKFEEGLRLGKHCRKILDRAELRVKKLVENADGQPDEEDFDSGE